MKEIRALAFDVFGTVVDWRASIIREGESLGRRKDLSVNWAAFADAWRAGYQPSMERVRRGEIPWTNLDGLHRALLEELLEKFGIEGLDEAEKDHLNKVWHRLAPWPDVPEGLARLRERYVLATLSNGNVSLLVEMAKRSSLPWDLILSAELVRRYKPDPEVYLMAPRLLDLEPQEVMMVAAHPDDLRAAAEVGLATALVRRPLEFGPGRSFRIPESGFDLVAGDFVELAQRLLGREATAGPRRRGAPRPPSPG
ncbi:MAG: haloacid dehalogenase type II [Rubrobacteraceae bacterium]|nr:haloacid dehalogenase type II [Rubrobacteraceae bacterium]